MFAELIDGTANSDLCLIIALILAATLCIGRAVYLKAFDPALVAAIIFFVILAFLVT